MYIAYKKNHPVEGDPVLYSVAVAESESFCAARKTLLVLLSGFPRRRRLASLGLKVPYPILEMQASMRV